MAEIILITGGSRSGKSAFAQQLAERQAGPRLFLATCPVTDGEMADRILRHIADRQQSGWDTIEEQIDVIGQLETAIGYGVVLIDCLTLWVNNIMYEAHRSSTALDEDIMTEKSVALVAAARKHPAKVIFVTNEVGSGIVPDNKDARLFRDLTGRCNQQVAAAADSVYLVSCGIPMQIKGSGNAI
jgi:adenosylcobinamide kinase/adenosylcobinamide-phosphate guanylyltransferase